MNNPVEDLVGHARWVARVAARRKWTALGVAVLLAAASAVGLNFWRDRYEASAKVYVDTQTVLKPLMSGLTYQPDIDQQVRMLANTLISRPNVERLIDMPELEFGSVTGQKREELIAMLLSRIKVTPTGTGNLYEISYRETGRERARRLVQATVDMFVQASTVGKKRDSVDAGRFIEEQIRFYEKKLVEAEDRLKEFKVRNFGTSGVSGQDYFARISALTDQVNKLRVELGAAEQSRETFRKQLASEDPLLPAPVARRTAGPAVVEAEARLEQAKKSLDDLLRRYTEAHPDVSGTRRTIASLEVELRQKREADERERAKEPPATGRAATSPVYQKLRISLAEADAQVASLRSQLGSLQVQLETVRASAGRMPQIEAELVQLNRDYDVMRKNYDTMVARRESAALGQKLDESSQLAEFRVVEPPRVLPAPVKPSRVHLAIIAALLSLTGGLAFAIVAELMRPTFDDAASLREFAGRPVLGTLSTLVTAKRRSAQRASAWRFGVSLGVLVLVQAGWVVWVAQNPLLR